MQSGTRSTLGKGIKHFQVWVSVGQRSESKDIVTKIPFCKISQELFYEF